MLNYQRVAAIAISEAFHQHQFLTFASELPRQIQTSKWSKAPETQSQPGSVYKGQEAIHSDLHQFMTSDQTLKIIKRYQQHRIPFESHRPSTPQRVPNLRVFTLCTARLKMVRWESRDLRMCGLSSRATHFS